MIWKHLCCDESCKHYFKVKTVLTLLCCIIFAKLEFQCCFPSHSTTIFIHFCVCFSVVHTWDPSRQDFCTKCCSMQGATSCTIKFEGIAFLPYTVCWVRKHDALRIKPVKVSHLSVSEQPAPYVQFGGVCISTVGIAVYSERSTLISMCTGHYINSCGAEAWLVSVGCSQITHTHHIWMVVDD